MNDSSAGGTPASVPDSDADLLNTIRSGDPRPYEVLRARHATAARSLAIHLPGGPDAADRVVDLTFTLVLDAIRDGGGPSDAFRPYLLTAVRRVAHDVARGSRASFPTDEQQISDPGQPLPDPGAPGLDGSPVVAAFLSLPERWRAVLWHTEVERAPPGQAGLFLGLSAAAVAELNGQARDGLERAYLQLQKAGAGPEVASIPDVGAALRGTVAPAVLGEATAAYLADTAALSGSAGPEATMAAGSVSTAHSGRSGGPGRSGGSGTRRRETSPHADRPAALTSMATRLSGTSVQQRALAGGVGALLGIVAVAVAVLTLGTEAGTATAAGDRQPGPPSVTASGPATSPPADSGANGGSGSSHPSPGTGQPGTAPPGAATPAPQPTTHPPVAQDPPPPDPAPVSSQPPSAQLTAQVSVLGPGMFGHLATVSFGIGDSGPGSSGTLTASISLPSGSTPMTGWRMPGLGGWSCTADSGGLSCSHGPIAASDRTGGLVAVVVTGSAACGQPVRITVSGGASVSTAESAATIECGQSQHARDAARTVQAGGLPGFWWPGSNRVPGRAHDWRAHGWPTAGWRPHLRRQDWRTHDWYTQNWHARDRGHSRHWRGRNWQ
jgi:DNA-directed RNA polymerase specialized sigma24 family protein